MILKTRAGIAYSNRSHTSNKFYQTKEHHLFINTLKFLFIFVRLTTVRVKRGGNGRKLLPIFIFITNLVRIGRLVGRETPISFNQ